MANPSSDLESGRNSPPPDATGSIDAFLGWDHRRLDVLFADARTLAESGKAAEALVPYDAFASGLEAHIAAEEEIVFPVFDESTGMRGMGPTAVMRIEHGEIRPLLAAIRASLAAGDLDAFHASAASLEGLLSMHNRKEEQMLYPAIDQIAAADGATAELVRRSREKMGFPER